MNLTQYLTSWKTAAGILSAVVVGAVAFGEQFREVWKYPEEGRAQIEDLSVAVSDLKDMVSNLRSDFEENRAVFDTSPCAEYLRSGNSMEDTAPGEFGIIELRVNRLRSECHMVRPIRIFVVDSSDSIYDAETEFEGRNLRVGVSEISYGVQVPDSVEEGLASVIIESTYRLPSGALRTVVSPRIPFNVLPQ